MEVTPSEGVVADGEVLQPHHRGVYAYTFTIGPCRSLSRLHYFWSIYERPGSTNNPALCDTPDRWPQHTARRLSNTNPRRTPQACHPHAATQARSLRAKPTMTSSTSAIPASNLMHKSTAHHIYSALARNCHCHVLAASLGRLRRVRLISAFHFLWP